MEKRFRVTEVFLAILWVRRTLWEGPLPAAEILRPTREMVCPWLTELVRTVLCGRVLVILFYGLPDVKMVRGKHSVARMSPTGLSICRLLFYTPSAAVVRLLTTNFLIAYVTSWVLNLSGASEDPRMLLPAWVSIATVRKHSGIAVFES